MILLDAPRDRRRKLAEASRRSTAHLIPQELDVAADGRVFTVLSPREREAKTPARRGKSKSSPTSPR